VAPAPPPWPSEGSGAARWRPPGANSPPSSSSHPSSRAGPGTRGQPEEEGGGDVMVVLGVVAVEGGGRKHAQDKAVQKLSGVFAFCNFFY